MTCRVHVVCYLEMQLHKEEETEGVEKKKTHSGFIYIILK